MANHLVAEKSPYLLQHANNPVDWYPWGDEAFEKARAESKPIFLSVGYSTCHWCHVMAHESFENESIAALLNENFVPIKVDREERPDVDRVYMLFVQATTGSGGWPMSVWLTPALEPFYGGTYFPPTARWGRPGFIDILEEIARVWGEEPDKVRRSAAQVTAQMKTFAARAGARAAAAGVGEETLRGAVAALQQDFDREHGGFGGAPKFPRPSELLFLLREYARRASQDASAGQGPSLADESARAASAALNVATATAARDMALTTLRAMARGGIHDHLGGGFHRYAVDARWHVPHFEKMLYDQAQLALAYLEAFQVTVGAGEAHPAGGAGVRDRGEDDHPDASGSGAGAADDVDFAGVASGILRYVARDLARPGGGFFSAEDADSLPPSRSDSDTGAGTQQPVAAHGAHDGVRPVEGAFYVWTDAEFGDVLGAAADAARRRFGVRPAANVTSDPHGEFHGKNVLYLASTVDEIARSSDRPAGEVAALLDEAKQRLFEARASRPRPGLDDKVIVAWNGLMIAAFARASRVLRGSDRGSPPLDQWLQPARQAARFIRETLWDAKTGRLLRRYREGEAGIDAYADDFACLIFGLLELFQADGDPDWLEWAVTLQQRQDELFWDDSEGGWFSTSGNDPSVLLRLKEDYDGAEPAASSVALWNVLTLARMTGEARWSGRAERVLAAFSAPLQQTPRALPMMLAGVSCLLARPQEIVIAGGADEGAAALFDALATRYLPFAVVIPLPPEHRAGLGRLVPFTDAMTARGGKATAYVCRDFACGRPTSNAAEMLRETGAAE